MNNFKIGDTISGKCNLYRKDKFKYDLIDCVGFVIGYTIGLTVPIVKVKETLKHKKDKYHSIGIFYRNLRHTKLLLVEKNNFLVFD